MQIFNLPQAASQREPFAITGDSCLRGGNHAGVRHRQEEKEPTESVDIGAQIGAVAKEATEIANATGSEVTLEMGGIKVTVRPTKNHAPTSIAQIDEPRSELKVRPEVQEFLDGLKTGEIHCRHTTRSPETPKPFVPDAPKQFNAGRFEVSFTDDSGEKKGGCIVETESKVGHFTPINPGQGGINGYVALLTDPNNDRSEGIRFTQDEQEALLETLYSKAGQQMTPSTAGEANAAICATAAVRYEGEGAQAVSNKHHSLI